MTADPSQTGSTGNLAGPPAPPRPLLNTTHAARLSAGLRTVVLLLVIIGLAARVAPLFNQNARLLKQFPTEDGYLMLTIARNIAIGNGMSTADGTIPTNGVQPAATFLWALCYRMVDGDKTLGVALVHFAQMILSALAAWLLYRLGREVLSGHPDRRAIAALAAAVWYAGSNCIAHTQNCLETGLYTFAVLLGVLAFLASFRELDRPWTALRCIGLGSLLGLAFWARNDAALLILAVCLTRLAAGRYGGREILRRRFVETVIMGATSVVVALPWLVFNRIRFGSIMPISGQSEAAYIEFGHSLLKLPVALAEHAMVVLPIPASVETKPIVVLGSLGVLVVFFLVLILVWFRTMRPVHLLMRVVLIYAIGLGAFYGLVFGASHFMGRYLFPLSPFLALVWSAAAVTFWRWLVGTPGRPRPPWLVRVAPVAPAALIMLVAALDARLYVKGRTHQHFQVVEWVAANVPEDAWVGAPQSGTLGYFHDRTINLDGKVNPEALRARLKNEIPSYVVEKNIQYLADWVGLADWAELPALKPHYELIVQDPQRNLAVLRRL